MRTEDRIWFLKAIGGGVIGLAIILPVEMYAIDYYKDTRPSKYDLMVDSSFTSEQYDVVVEAATLWMDGVHDRSKLDITVEMGKCPEDGSAMCIISTHDRINCPPVNPVAVGCTAGYSSWVDVEYGVANTLAILSHEMGHLFGIPDLDDPYPGVMNRTIDTASPHIVGKEDAKQYLRFRRKSMKK